MHPTSTLRPLLALLLVAGAVLTGPAGAADTPDYSAAERLLFMSPQLKPLKRPTTLRYAFRKTGSHEAGFEDAVTVEVRSAANGKCCAVHGDFLTGARRLSLPDIEGDEGGNPVIMFFLENDVRGMQRLTKGSQSHFRKQIRMALYNAATVRDTTFRLRDREVRGQEIVISPYLEDPNRPRFEQFARKEYRFWLSDAVPGGVLGIRTRIAAEAAGAPPLVVEELLVEGAQAPADLPS
jgi:hypothetical protein